MDIKKIKAVYFVGAGGIGMSAIAQLTDIHPGTTANMLVPFQRLDVALDILCLQLFFLLHSVLNEA